MRPAVLGGGVVFTGCGLLAIVLVAATLWKGPALALAVPLALVMAGIVVRFPFLGLMLVVLFSHLDALANILFEELPISGIKVLTFLTLAGVVVNSYSEPRRERLGPDEPALRLAVLFGVTLVVSGLFAEHLDLAARSLQRFLGLLVLFYLVIRLIRTLKEVELLLLAIVVATLLSSLVVLWDYFHEGELLVAIAEGEVQSNTNPSATSGASNLAPTHAATMLLAGTTLAMMFILRIPRWRLLTGSTVLAGSAAQFLTFARAATLVFAFSVVWYVFKLRGDRKFPLFVMTGLMAALSVLPFIPSEYWETMSHLGDIGSGFSTDDSLSVRLTQHFIAIDLLAQHPLFGIGPGNYRAFFMDADYRWLPGRTLVPLVMHNTYLSIAVEAGLVAFACFVALLLTALRSLVRVLKYAPSEEVRRLAETLLFSFVSFFLVSAASPNEYNKYTWILAGLAVALARVGLPSAGNSASSVKG